jgi:4-hydroxy-3-polyprenylbenzoate decarboxylase
MGEVRRIVLGVSGASGAVLALKVAELLSTRSSVETHLVVSSAAERTLSLEAGPSALTRLKSLCRVWHDNRDIGSSIASGSFRVHGMIVAPCSMRSLAAIATGNTDNLLTRSADVQLKERRRLILLTRETPLHLGHLRNMVSVTEMGATVMPPVPAFYHRPASTDEIVHHISARAIDLLDLPIPPLADPWCGDPAHQEGGHQ